MLKGKQMSKGKVQAKFNLSIVNARAVARERSACKLQARHVKCYSQSQPDISSSIDEDSIASGEWPANWSLASYEDVGEYYAGRVLKEEQGHNVSGIMTTNILTAGPTDSSQSLTKLFDHVTGVPVVDSEGVCIGIVSKKDLAKKGKTVSEIMSAPARTIKQTNSVGEAAAIMLKYKVNRLPVVNKNGEVIGIVSRTDIFTALESMEE